MPARGGRRKVVAEDKPSYSPRRLLLDTHVWLWWQRADRRLGPNTRRAIAHTDEVRFSVVSAWEIAIKATLGKIDLPPNADIARELARDGFTELAVTMAHAEAVRRLPPLHPDPFDRMLVAQATHEGLTIITVDAMIGEYGVPVMDGRE